MIGYKVCRAVDDRFYSIFISGSAKVEYILNETTIPATDCGPLTIFMKRQQAIDWINGWSEEDADVQETFALLKCTYTKSNSVQIFSIDKDPMTGFSLTSWISECPVGTVLATSITPTRRII